MKVSAVCNQIEGKYIMGKVGKLLRSHKSKLSRLNALDQQHIFPPCLSSVIMTV